MTEHKICDICLEEYSPYKSNISATVWEDEWEHDDKKASFHICDLCFRSKLIKQIMDNFNIPIYDGYEDEPLTDLSRWGFQNVRDSERKERKKYFERIIK